MRIILTKHKNKKLFTEGVEICNPLGLNEYYLAIYNEISEENYERKLKSLVNEDWGGMNNKIEEYENYTRNVLTPKWFKNEC